MRIKELIIKEISYIFENKEYNEIIDNINLTDEYNKLNSQLFNNKLPSIPLEWSDRNNTVGCVNGVINKGTKKIVIKNLTISRFYALTYKMFQNVLAHEMIHVKQIMDGGIKTSDPHGYDFLSEMNRINQLGFNVTIYMSDEIRDISDRTKDLNNIIGIILKLDNKVLACTTTYDIYNSEFKYVIKLIQDLVNRGKCNNGDIIVVNTKKFELLKLPIKETLKDGNNYSVISNQLYNELLKDKIIQHEKVGELSLVENNEWEEIVII